MTTDTRPNTDIAIDQDATAPKAAPASGATPGQDATAPKTGGGLRDTIAGYGERAIDAVAGAAGRGDDPRVGKAKDFVRSKPLAVAAAAGVIGLALLNTLGGFGRGRGRGA